MKAKVAIALAIFSPAHAGAAPARSGEVAPPLRDRPRLRAGWAAGTSIR